MILNKLRDNLPTIESHALRESDHQEETLGAAVLAAFTVGANEPEIILTRRSQKMRSHAGEVALPGGKIERIDNNLIETALRESHEEIGLRPDQVEVIGQITPMNSRQGVKVHPFVGFVDAGLVFEPCSEELDAIFKVPVSLFYDKSALITQSFKMNKKPFEMTAFQYKGFTIWGLTAMIIINILNQVNEEQIDQPVISQMSQIK